MNRMRGIVRRTTMTMLTFIALLSTYTSVTGVPIRELSHWLFHEGLPSLGEFFHRKSTVTMTRETFVPKQKLASSEVTVDLSMYPARTVIATGYTAGVESTGKTPDHPAYGITYSGVKVTRDRYSTIAADTSIYPIGTILYIPDYGYGVVADTGSAIKGDKIDLYFETVAKVYEQWGKREVTVYTIAEGDGTLSEEVMKQLNEDESMQVFHEELKEDVR